MRESELYPDRATLLRQRQTRTEKIMWKHLRAKRFHGHKFRRQVPIGRYIVDFLCNESRLIIEVDGDSHWQPGAQEYDRKRERYLIEQGYRVIRFGNQDVIGALDSVLERIRRSL